MERANSRESGLERRTETTVSGTLIFFRERAVLCLVSIFSIQKHLESSPSRTRTHSLFSHGTLGAAGTSHTRTGRWLGGTRTAPPLNTHAHPSLSLFRARGDTANTAESFPRRGQTRRPADTPGTTCCRVDTRSSDDLPGHPGHPVISHIDHILPPRAQPLRGMGDKGRR